MSQKEKDIMSPLNLNEFSLNSETHILAIILRGKPTRDYINTIFHHKNQQEVKEEEEGRLEEH